MSPVGSAELAGRKRLSGSELEEEAERSAAVASADPFLLDTKAAVPISARIGRSKILLGGGDYFKVRFFVAQTSVGTPRLGTIAQHLTRPH